MAHQLTVATYNIHKCIGRDGSHEPARTLEVLRELDADIIGLQEFDTRRRRGRSLVDLSHFEEGTGHSAFAHPVLMEEEGYQANVLMTRLPVRAVRSIDLTVPWSEPRGALIADLEAHGQPIRVAVAHFSLTAGARRKQAAKLIEELDGVNGTPVIALGDFNEWLPVGGCEGIFVERFGAHPRPRSFPARCPFLGLDRVWAAPRDCLLDMTVHRSPLARQASDHLPLRATIAI